MTQDLIALECETPLQSYDLHTLLTYDEQLGQRMAQDFLTKGAIWKVISDNKLWEKEADTFYEFCKLHGRKYRTIRYYITVYETFGDLGKDLEGISFHKLTVIESHVRRMPIEERKEWIEKAKIPDWTEDDLKDEIRRDKGEPTHVDCAHEKTIQVVLTICEDCNKTVKRSNNGVQNLP